MLLTTDLHDFDHENDGDDGDVDSQDHDGHIHHVAVYAGDSDECYDVGSAQTSDCWFLADNAAS